jgi:hypothetical protein
LLLPFDESPFDELPFGLPFDVLSRRVGIELDSFGKNVARRTADTHITRPDPAQGASEECS